MSEVTKNRLKNNGIKFDVKLDAKEANKIFMSDNELDDITSILLKKNKGKSNTRSSSNNKEIVKNTVIYKPPKTKNTKKDAKPKKDKNVDEPKDILEKIHLGNCDARISYKKLKNFMVDGIFDELSYDHHNFKNSRGYVKGNIVYIWADKKPKNPPIPTIYYDKELHDYVFIDKTDVETSKYFTIDKIRDISMEKIEEDLSDHENLYSEEQMEYITRSQSEYKPKINPGDDFLKQVVKKIIMSLGINVNKFMNQFNEKHTLINMKTGLAGKTKTSPKIFSKWMELFKLDFTIVVNLKKATKQGGYILYTSKDNQIGVVSDIHKSDFD